jgi:hypothetical protein
MFSEEGRVAMNVEVPDVLYREIERESKRLNFASVQDVIVEALEFYSEHFLGSMTPRALVLK